MFKRRVGNAFVTLMDKSTRVNNASTVKIKAAATAKRSADTIGEGVEQALYGCYVLHDGALLDAAHKLVLVQRPLGELELLDVVVGLSQRLLVLHLHLTDPRRCRQRFQFHEHQVSSGAPRLTFRRSLFSSGRLSTSCLSSGRRDSTNHVTRPAGKMEVSVL